MQNELSQCYRQEYETLQNGFRHEAPWLKATRNAALEQFFDLGFPNQSLETWKYTRVTPIENHFFATTAEDDSISLEHIQQHEIKQAQRLVFVNGHYAAKLSQLNKLPAGVILTSLRNALTEHHDLLQNHFNKKLTANAHGFVAMNTAFMQDGLFLYIPKETKLKAPIHVLYLTTAANSQRVAQIRNIIIAEANTEAVVVENYVGADGSNYFNNIITEIDVHDNAQIHHCKIQREGNKGYHIATTETQQARDSQFYSHVLSFGGSLVRSDLNIQAVAAGTQSHLYGFYLAQNRQHMDFHTQMLHQKPHGTSDEFYKGVLTDNARVVFNGKVKVFENAIKTNAQQSNKNLILSNQAEIDSKPELEIYNDDVKCSHGATAGDLDKNALFYFQSRGIDLDTARNILQYAFASEIIEKITDPSVQHYVDSVLIKHLPNFEMQEELSWKA